MDEKQARNNGDSPETKIAEDAVPANAGDGQQSGGILDVVPVSFPWWQRLIGAIWRWIKQDTKSTDWFIVLLTAVIAATSYLQWKVIKSGSADTHTLAEAAKTQAEKTSGMADAADKIRKAADDMVAQESRLATNSQNAIEASNHQSKASLEATIAASRLEERAWVGIRDVRLVRFDKDKSLKVDVEVRNTGKTPALSVQLGSGWATDMASTGPAANWFNYSFRPAESIPPEGDHIIHIEVPSNVITPLYDVIMIRPQFLFVMGTVRYETIADQPGEANFCLFLNAQSKEMQFCGSHNDMK